MEVGDYHWYYYDYYYHYHYYYWWSTSIGKEGRMDGWIDKQYPHIRMLEWR